LPAGEIAEISTQRLSILLDLITYFSGYPARQVDTRRVERAADGSAANPLKTTLQVMYGKSSIVRPVRLPAETKLLQTARLQVWLRLAIDSRPPASAIDAIRNYYMTCEDMLHGQRPTKGSPEQELKFARDFVSHGVAMDNQDLLDFLKREIGPGTSQYDPLNPTHQTFLEKRRECARQLVESKIDAALS